ncbi:Pisatin demethylase [Cladorrhinum sp. PSN259]|nr:Pisatin demethylase [Cladorrhinum sp. PSN259]
MAHIPFETAADYFSRFSLFSLLGITLFLPLAVRVIYNLYFHPLSKFPGPWYAAVSSFPIALISIVEREPEWLLHVTRKYGKGDLPVRIAPALLLFPKPSALRDIYWDPKNNTKGRLYGTGALGAPSIFTLLSGDEHRELRKALGGAQWGFTHLKTVWEPRIDDLLRLFTRRMTEFAEKGEVINLGDKVAQFAGDVMTMVAFNEPWGFVDTSTDRRRILQSFRSGMRFFGLAGRWLWLRETVLPSPLGPYLIPKAGDKEGMGWLASEADRVLTEREKMIDEMNYTQDDAPQKDYTQYAIEARKKSGDGDAPLSRTEKHAHLTLLIQAGADTTGTALGSTLRFLLLNPACLSKCQKEIQEADTAGLLSAPVQFEETRSHLRYMMACISESLRLNPPALNLFSRASPRGEGGRAGGSNINGVVVPEGVEFTSNAWVVQRDPELYGPDPEVYRPERWLEGDKRTAELESGMFVWGVGPRICLGKDIAVMELYKVLPEIIRRFDIELLEAGRFRVIGGVAFNAGFMVKLFAKKV